MHQITNLILSKILNSFSFAQSPLYTIFADFLQMLKIVTNWWIFFVRVFFQNKNFYLQLCRNIVRHSILEFIIIIECTSILYACFCQQRHLFHILSLSRWFLVYFRKNNPLNLLHFFPCIHFRNDSDKSNYGNYLIVQAATSDSCWKVSAILFSFSFIWRKIVLCCAIIRVYVLDIIIHFSRLDV